MAWSSFALAAAAILLALLRTVPNAVRLGRRTDAAEGQSELARSIWRDHLCCFGVIALLLTIQLTFARS